MYRGVRTAQKYYDNLLRVGSVTIKKEKLYMMCILLYLDTTCSLCSCSSRGRHE